MITNKKGLTSFFVMFFLMFSTQISFYITNILTSEKTLFNLFDIVGVILFIYCVVYKILIKKDILNLNRVEKYLFWACFILSCYFLATIPLRFFIYNKLTVSISMIKVVVFGAVIFFTCKYISIKFNSVIQAIICFELFLNIWALSKYLFFEILIRNSNILSNINIYVGFTFLITPFIVSFSFHINIFKVLQYLVFLTTIPVIILSGSRVGIWIYLFEVIISLFITSKRKFSIKKIECYILTAILSFVLLFGLAKYNSKSRTDISRSFYFPQKILIEVFNLDKTIDIESIYGTNQWDKSLQDEENVNPDVDNLDNNEETFSLTRDRLLSRSLQILSKYWLIGTGRHSLYFSGWGYQTPHNFILEILICFGIIGGIFYLAVILIPFIVSFLYRNKSPNYLFFCLSFLIILVYSMVEPILSDKLIVVGVMWTIFSVLYYTPKQTENKRTQIKTREESK